MKKGQKTKTQKIHEKETELFKKYKELINSGYSEESPECESIRNEILSLNIDFCLSKAHKRYANLVKKTGDVWEVANLVYLGLVRAFPNYDPDKGVYFTSFAEYDIRHVISEFYYNDSNIKSYDAELIRKYNKAKEKIVQMYGTEDRPISDYQAVSGLSAPNLLRAQAISTRADRVFVSNEEIYDTMGASDYGNPENEAIDNYKQDVLLQTIEKLTPLEKDVISLYFGFSTPKPLPISTIAKELDVTVGEVKRCLNHALLVFREDNSMRQCFGIGRENREEAENSEDYDFKVCL